MIRLVSSTFKQANTIAIMAGGHLQCVGSSLRLKQRFGAGYRVSVGTQDSHVQDVIQFFQQNVEGVQVQGKPIGGYINLTIPRTSNHQLVPFFEALEKSRHDLGIHDLQLSLTTLEEVFLSVAESAELKRIGMEGYFVEVNSSAARFAEDLQASPEDKQDALKPERLDDDQPDKCLFQDVELGREGLDRPELDRVRRRDQFRALMIKVFSLF